MVQGLDVGPKDLPPVTVSVGLQIRAVFWDRSLAELEVKDGLYPALTSSLAQPVPELETERIFETNVTEVGATPWMETNDKTVHEVRLPLPTDEQCADQTRGMGCRVRDGDATPCMTECPLSPVEDVEPTKPFVPPPPFDQTPCPSGQWIDGDWMPQSINIVDDMIATCEPPPPSARMSCPDGQIQIPGADRCVTLGAACGPDGFTTKPLPADTIYVRLGASGTGEKMNPLGSINAAIGQSNAGGTIAVAVGTYGEDVQVSKPIHLIGGCASQTVIFSRTNGATFNASASVEDMTIDGPPAITVQGDNVEVDLRGVALKGVLTIPLLRVRDNGFVRGSTITMQGPRTPIEVSSGGLDLDVVVADSSALAHLSGPSSTATISHVVASGFPIDADALRVDDGAHLVLRSAELVGFLREGVAVSGRGSVLSLHRTALRSAAGSVQRLVNYGVTVRDHARLVGDVVLIEKAAAGGMLIEQSSIALVDALIRDNGTGGTAGASIVQDSHAQFTRVTLERNDGPGLRLCGGALDTCDTPEASCDAPSGACTSVVLEDTLILGRPDSASGRDFGVIVAPRSYLEANGLVVAQNSVGGISIDPTATASISNARVLDHRGTNLRYGIGLPEDGQLYLASSEIVGVEGRMGLVLAAASHATLTHVRFARTGPKELDPSCGRVNASVADRSVIVADHLDITGGGIMLMGAQTEGTISHATIHRVEEDPGAPVCANTGAAVHIDHLSADHGHAITIVDATLTASHLRFDFVERGITAKHSTITVDHSSFSAAEASRGTLISLTEQSTGIFTDLKITEAQTAILGAGDALSVARFEIAGSFIGIDSGEGDLNVTDGYIHGYNHGIIYRNRFLQHRDFFINMLYDVNNLDNAVVFTEP